MSGVHLLTAFLGIATLSLLFSAASKGRDRFAFRVVVRNLRDEIGSDGKFRTLSITGDIQNLSTKANCLSGVYLVRWSRDRLGVTFCDPHPVKVQEGAEDVELPLRFDGKQDKRVTLSWKFQEDVCDDSAAFEVALGDSEGKLHDQWGRLKDRRNIERRREFADYVSGASGGKLSTFLVAFLKIKVFDLAFLVRRLIWFIGL